MDSGRRPFVRRSLDRRQAQTHRRLPDAYMTIFTGNPRASKLNTIYLDAFAGTGFRTSPIAEDRAEGSLFEDALEDPDADSLKRGSSYVALRTEPAFGRYIFVDRNPDHAKSLEKLRQEFPELADRISVQVADANAFLQDWCQNTDWRKSRAVVFLDPYGMQVDWSTIEAIAATKAIDLWILFPLGQAVNRLLTRNDIPAGGQAQRLTRFSGPNPGKTPSTRKPKPSRVCSTKISSKKQAMPRVPTSRP